MKCRYDMNMQARPVMWHYKGSRLILRSLLDSRRPTSSNAHLFTARVTLDLMSWQWHLAVMYRRVLTRCVLTISR
jgi:hypothetical protein